MQVKPLTTNCGLGHKHTGKAFAAIKGQLQQTPSGLFSAAIHQASEPPFLMARLSLQAGQQQLPLQCSFLVILSLGVIVRTLVAGSAQQLAKSRAGVLGSQVLDILASEVENRPGKQRDGMLLDCLCHLPGTLRRLKVFEHRPRERIVMRQPCLQPVEQVSAKLLTTGTVAVVLSGQKFRDAAQSQRTLQLTVRNPHGSPLRMLIGVFVTGLNDTLRPVSTRLQTAQHLPRVQQTDQGTHGRGETAEHQDLFILPVRRFDGRDCGQDCRVFKQMVTCLKRLNSRLQPPLHALLALVIDSTGLLVNRQHRRNLRLVDLR